MPLDTTILIADEQSLCREGLVALINRTWPDAVTVQADRLSGVVSAISKNEAIGLMVLDLELPDLMDVQTIRQLRIHYPGVRIVVTSASLGRDMVVDCLRAGVHGCIAKSSTAEEIAEALEMVIGGKIYVPAIVCAGEEATHDFTPSGKTSGLLSERQKEVLRVLAAGKSNKEIARQLGIAEGTVKVHVNAVFRALGVHNRVGAVAAYRDVEATDDCEPSLPGLIHPNRRAADDRHPFSH